MAWAAVRSKAVDLLLLIHSILLLPLFVLYVIGSCFVFSVICVLSSFAIILMGNSAGCFTLMVFMMSCDC